MLPQRIILHHSATADGVTVSWQAIRRFHTSYRYDGKAITKEQAILLVNEQKQVEAPWSDIGYHYGIELINDTYEILVGRMMNKIGAHAQGENHDSLGVCFVGDFDLDPVPAAQWRCGLVLVRTLMNVFEILPDEVYGHRDFSTKSCPGLKFDMEAFRSEL